MQPKTLSRQLRSDIALRRASKRPALGTPDGERARLLLVNDDYFEFAVRAQGAVAWLRHG